MDKPDDHFPEFAAKMAQAGVSEAAMRAFRHNYQRLLAGNTGLIPESEIQPVRDLPSLAEIARDTRPDLSLLDHTAVLKLNGGLGTSMGLEKAKSLLPVRDGLTFLDYIARQILWLRSRHHTQLRFVLMNSFATSEDTLEHLKRYPELGAPAELELLQSQIPKVDAATLRPVSWPDHPQLEWCPPGHGDIYPSLLASGMLESFLNAGVKYLFVSNSDNLGATLDASLLTWFARSDKPFVMEVAERTPSDRKGGHLALRHGRFLLRESAQTVAEDEPAFQDIRKHRFFNTNNLWLRLDQLLTALKQSGGFLPLPLISNRKTVDPRLKHSTPVIQLETAMGSAIELFENSGAVIVGRERFAPVKTTSDLFLLRSDAYTITEDLRFSLSTGRNDGPPNIDLDPLHYKLVDQLETKTTAGVPSLKACTSLTVRGPVAFRRGNVFRGVVAVSNTSAEERQLPDGEYHNVSQVL